MSKVEKYCLYFQMAFFAVICAADNVPEVAVPEQLESYHKDLNRNLIWDKLYKKYKAEAESYQRKIENATKIRLEASHQSSGSFTQLKSDLTNQSTDNKTQLESKRVNQDFQNSTKMESKKKVNGSRLKSKPVNQIFKNVTELESKKEDQSSKNSTQGNNQTFKNVIGLGSNKKEQSSKNANQNFDRILLEKLLEKLSKLESQLKAKEEPSPSNYDRNFNSINTNHSLEFLPKSCSEATSKNKYADGPYLLKISNTNLTPFYVYCFHDKAKGKAWMIIQRREDGSVSFNRNWLDYKNGFGDLYTDYWIGLERLHQMTRAASYDLWISLKNENGRERSSRFSTFSVSSEANGYSLTTSGYRGWPDGKFKDQKNIKFSTADKDNDQDIKNCAQYCKGGWWFETCGYCHLNGRDFSPEKKHGCTLRRYYQGFLVDYLKYTQMAIHLK